MHETRQVVPLPSAVRWAALGAFVVFLVVGVVIRWPANTAIGVVGVLVALAAAVPLFLLDSRLRPLHAVVAVAGVALLITDRSGSANVGWFTTCVVAAWVVAAGGPRAGAIYYAACVLLLAGEWLFVVRDPGWGSWFAGVTLSALAAGLVRHQFVLMTRLRQAQAALIEQSRVEERNRIARELHDIIAHSLTVSLLHISSARLALDEDPADAARALAEAERLGRQSLDEVRATMGIARSEAAHGIARPAPGIGDLATLVDQMSHAGVDVRLIAHGDLTALPATVGVTVYRIVQEALTNAAKHAPGATVIVTATVFDGRLGVAIDSAGAPGHGSGIGLSSMRERAAAVGGTCTAGPGGGGWLVEASLPLAVVATSDGAV